MVAGLFRPKTWSPKVRKDGRYELNKADFMCCSFLSVSPHNASVSCSLSVATRGTVARNNEMKRILDKSKNILNK